MQNLKLVILGNNLDAWITTAYLLREQYRLTAPIELTLCCGYSNHPQVGRIVTAPIDRELFRYLGISEKEILSAGDGHFSLGYAIGKLSEIRTFTWGDTGFDFDGLGFQHLWTWYKQQDSATHPWHAYSFTHHMSEAQKFVHPQEDRQSILSLIDYGLSVDEAALLELVRSRVEADKLRIVDEQPQFNGSDLQNQTANSLQLHSGELLSADLIIDCRCETRRPLFSAGPRMEPGTADVITQLHACNGLWQAQENSDSHQYRWVSPLESPQAASAVLACSKWLEQESLASADISVTEIIQKPWNSHLLVLGTVATGSPLPALSPLYLLHRQLSALVKLLPGDTSSLDVCAREYNRTFSVLRERLTEWRELWSYAAGSIEASGLETSMAHTIALFRSRGKLALNDEPLLSDKDMIKLLIALGIEPEGYDPLLDHKSLQDMARRLSSGSDMLVNSVQQLPDEAVYRAHFLK